MRIPINLSSQPPENLRPLRTAVVVTMLAAVLLSIILVQREFRSRREFRALIDQQAKLEQNLQNFKSQQQELESWLMTPEAAQVRDRSAFLNSLILRKGLSWTQMFVDLEKTLPPKARIVSIKPTVGSGDDVQLALTVASASMPPLVDFLKNLESSPQFGPPTVGAQRYGSDKSGSNDISIELTTAYRQAHLIGSSTDGTALTDHGATADDQAMTQAKPQAKGQDVSAAAVEEQRPDAEESVREGSEEPHEPEVNR
jgi:type IV pilus assembly protein PilN